MAGSACPSCRKANRPGRRFCGACGASLGATCPRCGFLNDPEDRFCGGCGGELRLSPAAAAGGSLEAAAAAVPGAEGTDRPAMEREAAAGGQPLEGAAAGRILEAAFGGSGEPETPVESEQGPESLVQDEIEALFAGERPSGDAASIPSPLAGAGREAAEEVDRGAFPFRQEDLEGLERAGEGA